jgi:hypothetical protein
VFQDIQALIAPLENASKHRLLSYLRRQFLDLLVRSRTRSIRFLFRFIDQEFSVDNPSGFLEEVFQGLAGITDSTYFWYHAEFIEIVQAAETQVLEGGSLSSVPFQSIAREHRPETLIRWHFLKY